MPCAARSKSSAAWPRKMPRCRREPAIEFRIGINVGDIIIDGDEFSATASTSRRGSKAIAEPGGICISDDAHRADPRQGRFVFDDLGEQIAQEYRRADARVATLAAGSSTSAPSGKIARRLPSRPRALPDRPSIAVLPFQNMSGDPEQEYFADGMVEDIITALSRFNRLFVIARNSSLHLQGQGRRHQAGRPRTRRALRARGQRPQGRQPGAHHRAAHRRRDRQPYLGRQVRRRPRGCVRPAGSSHHECGGFDRSKTCASRD